METAKLTFRELNDRIDALPDHPSMAITPTRRQRWGCFIGFGAGVIGIVGGKVLPDNKLTLALVLVAVTIEIVAVGVALIPRRPWRFHGFAAERREFAEQMDFDKRHYDELIAWLRQFPKTQLDALAQYASDRHERLKDRHPLITGGIDKLGAIPVVAALYLQFKNFHWPPQITWPEFFLGCTLVGFYWGSLLLVNVRFRAQFYEMVLKRATEQVSDGESAACQPASYLGEAVQ